MKNSSLLFLLACLMLAFVVSCRSTLPARFEQFVNRVEKNASSYSQEEWQKASTHFSKLMEQYEKAHDKLSQEERSRIEKAIGRYRAIAVKSGIKDVIRSLDNAISEFSSRFNDYLDGAESFLKELLDTGSQ